MKSFWINLGVKDINKACNFYRNIGFHVTEFGEIRSVTLEEGGNLILFQKDEFKKRVPFHLASDGNEVLISLNVSTKEEVDRLIKRVKEQGGRVTIEPTEAYGYYGASFVDLDDHHFNVIVM